jgi:hypothetical protein
MSVFVAVKAREVVLSSLPLRAVCTRYAENHRPRLEEVFCGELALKPDHK